MVYHKFSIMQLKFQYQVIFQCTIVLYDDIIVTWYCHDIFLLGVVLRLKLRFVLWKWKYANTILDV